MLYLKVKNFKFYLSYIIIEIKNLQIIINIIYKRDSYEFIHNSNFKSQIKIKSPDPGQDSVINHYPNPQPKQELSSKCNTGGFRQVFIF